VKEQACLYVNIDFNHAIVSVRPRFIPTSNTVV